MAKVATVNVITGPEVGNGLFALADLLLANGYTNYSTGTGTAGTRSVTNQLTSAALWSAAANTWQIVFRGSVYVTFVRISSTQISYRVAVTAPTVVGSATVPDSQAVAANEVSYGTLSVSSSTRAHAISTDTDSNAAGIRSFALIYTDGTSILRGSFVLEAMADGSFPMANPAPYVVGAAAGGTLFVAGSGSWSWWYSPTATWTGTANPIGGPYSNNYLTAVAAAAGVNPWSSEDQGVAPCWGRPTSGVQPGFVGQGATIKAATVNRGYPSTVNLATDAYLYVGTTSGSCLIPWPNGVVPL